VSCSANHEEASPVLYVNNVNVSNPYTTTHAVGAYNYSCNISETENYFFSETSNLLNIGQGVDIVNLYLNEQEDNITLTYGVEVNATATSATGTHNLFRNNTNVDSENGLNITLASGYYEYKANSTGNANYSNTCD